MKRTSTDSRAPTSPEGTPMRFAGRLPTLVALAILVSATCLSLLRLDNTYFWDDEALVGINARNLLLTGKFTGWDGRNLYAFRNGRLLDDNLRTRDTDLHFALTALSFKIFGVSTWAGRFPSVLLGLATLGLLWWMLRRQFRVPWQWAAYATASLAFSVSFLLSIRQCRYYALVIFLALLVFCLHQRCLTTRRWRDFLLLAAAAILLFYAHFLTGATFLIALGIMHGLCFIRQVNGRDWFKWLTAAGLFCAIAVPYAVAQKIWARPEITSGLEPVWWVRWLSRLWWNVRDLNLIGGLPWMLAAGLVALLVLKRQEESARRVVWPVLAACLGYVIALAILSPQPIRSQFFSDVRYLMPIFPLLAVALGWGLWQLHQRSRFAAAGVFLLMVSCTGFSLAPGHASFRWLLPAYLREIVRPYPTAYRAVADFLEKHAQQDDLVFAQPDYCNYPLMFYQGHRVRFCCLLNEESPLSPAKVRALGAPLYAAENFPTWFIAFGGSDRAAEWLQFFSRPHVADGRTNQYAYHHVTNLAIFWFDTGRPELPWHSFGPKTDFDPIIESVHVFKRVAAQAP